MMSFHKARFLASGNCCTHTGAAPPDSTPRLDLMSQSVHDANSEPNEPLVDSRQQQTAPEAPVKRITAAVLALIMLVSLLLPWWQTQFDFRETVGGPLHGWQLIQIGFGSGHAEGSGLSAIGRVALGLVPTLPLIVLALMLVVRAARPRAITAPTIAIWAVLELLAIGWLQVLGWAQLNRYLGVHPALFGTLIAAMACLFALIAYLNWWRRGERDHFAVQGPGQADAVAPLSADDLVSELTDDATANDDADMAVEDSADDTDDGEDVQGRDESR